MPFRTAHRRPVESPTAVMDIIAKVARPLAHEVHQERGAPLTVTMSINEVARENPSQRVSLQEMIMIAPLPHWVIDPKALLRPEYQAALLLCPTVRNFDIIESIVTDSE